MYWLANASWKSRKSEDERILNKARVRSSSLPTIVSVICWTQRPISIRNKSLTTTGNGVSFWELSCVFGQYYAVKFESGLFFTLKSHQMLFVHNTPQKFQNVTINGYFGFDLKTTWLPWSYRFRKPHLFKMSFVQTTTQSSDSWASGLSSSPGWRHSVVFLARHLTLTVPLSTQLYKWVPANSWRNLTNFGWLTCDGLASRPGEVELRPAASCYTVLFCSVTWRWPRQS